MDLAHLTTHRRNDFDVYIGERTRKRIGNKKWNKRAQKLIGTGYRVQV